MRRILNHSVAGLALATALPLSAQAATISGWNTDNVVLGGPVTGTEWDASVVYDRDATDPDAITNGKIY